ncbi:MAG: hypothetical protein ACE5JU_01795 [Candidatus Binatia bacterium]
MKDTPTRMERKFHDMILERSVEERLKMGCSMHAKARASVLEEEPLASPGTLRKALFLRFYGRDFDPARRKKILRALERP